jgi:hypothetical protein
VLSLRFRRGNDAVEVDPIEMEIGRRAREGMRYIYFFPDL